MIAATTPTDSGPVRRLPGMRDLSADACRDARAVQQRFAALVARYGYLPMDVPILESTELFMRKSGGSLASRMYSFIDPGSNAVSLRPEFTSAIMRRYLETAADAAAAAAAGPAAPPVARWHYAGPVFRYDTADAAGSGQFTQIGAELIGSDSILADAELLSLAAAAPAALGIPGCQLRLADLDVLDSVLDTVGLSDRARSFIVASMNSIGPDAHSIAAALEQARQLHVMAGHDLPDDANVLAAAVAGLPDADARAVLFGFMRWNGSAASTAGQRTPDEIVNRLLRKLRGGDAPDAVAHGLKLAGQLAAVKGPPDAAIAQVRAIVSANGAAPAAAERLAALLDVVSDDPAIASHLSIDFSLARGIAYYNGIIFDIVAGPAGANLGGGGRYDALARALGSPSNVPALGFACTLEKLLSAIPPTADDTPADDIPIVIAPTNPDAYRAALRAANNIRRNGGIAVLDVGGPLAHNGKPANIRTVNRCDS